MPKPELLKQFQRESRDKRLSEMTGETVKPRETYVKREVLDQLEESLLGYIADLQEELERIKKLKTEVIFPNISTVQKSLSIPVKVDEGGTGATDATTARANLGIGTDANTINLGDPTVNGSWRMTISGVNLVVEKREAGAWVEKGQFQP